MCGICGVVAYDRAPELDTVKAMLGQLAHRGPDGEGFFSDEGIALGHRRLAIIDRSDAGLQPFSSHDGLLQLVHNGEVYNYLELREELEEKGHRFRSATDTEVILAAYAEWGERCVERFNGMWAFALWDSPARRLFCSRDRLGVKPFYYRFDRGRFVFASELKAFRGDPKTHRQLNRSAARDYLEQGLVDHSVDTFFAGVVRLPPAHSLRLDRHGLSLRRYWSIEPGLPMPRDPAAAFRELFFDAIRMSLRSDVPIGTCLSGGLDSSAIACVVDRLLETEAQTSGPVGARQRTFTVYFDGAGLDERPYAEAVVRQTGAEAHWISFSGEDLVENLPTIVYAQDEPFGSTSIAAQWYVMRAAKEAGLKVMLDGQGADELLAGYRVYVGFRLADLLLRRQFSQLHLELQALRRLHGMGYAAIVSALVRPFLPEPLERRVRAGVSRTTSLLHRSLRNEPSLRPEPELPFGDRLQQRLYHTLTSSHLPALLRYEDRNSMAHSLEARVPFLDHRLVELVFSLTGEHIILDGTSKVVLRRALADSIPPVVLNRIDKIAFATPESQWFAGPLGHFAAEVFHSRRFADRGLVDARAARLRLERHRRGDRSAGFELWRALNIELWATLFLDA